MIHTGSIENDIIYDYRWFEEKKKKGSELIGLGISILIFD